MAAKTRDADPLRLALGYGSALAAAASFAVGGVIGKAAIGAGLLPSELAELRVLFAFLAFLLIGAASRPRDLRVRRADLPLILFFGVFALGAVQWAYYEAIARMPLGIAIVIQYLGTLLLLGYVRSRGLRVGGRLWVAAGLTLAGTALLVGAYDASVLSRSVAGIPFAALGAAIFAMYLLLAERILARYPIRTLLVYGFGSALAAWIVLRPPGSLPWALLAQPVNAALLAGVVVIATVIPFALIFASVSLIPAARSGLVSTSEPVFAAAVAWFVLGETLDAAQLVGGAVVLAGVVVAQSLRPRVGGV